MAFFFRSKRPAAKPRPAAAPFESESARLLALLQRGFFACPKCETPVETALFDSLTLANCPCCDEPLFVPAKIKTYYLFRPLGGGGMGSVYKAVSEHAPQEFFAVKVLPREQREDPELISRLQREAKTALRFRGLPHCEVGVEYGCAEGEHFFAMEFIPGPRLDELIATRERLDCIEALRLGQQLLSAETRIYDSGYLYRDLKPENVIVRADAQAYLIDFGLCVPLQEALRGAVADHVEGSVHYLPPERMAGLGEDDRSEIYSLGMVLFHAIAGRTFFDAEEAADIAGKHLAAARLADCSASLPSDVAASVSALLNEMIRKRPDQRIASFQELSDRLEAVLHEVTARGRHG
jgi:serine/threonine protein kinase